MLETRVASPNGVEFFLQALDETIEPRYYPLSHRARNLAHNQQGKCVCIELKVARFCR